MRLESDAIGLRHSFSNRVPKIAPLSLGKQVLSDERRIPVLRLILIDLELREGNEDTVSPAIDFADAETGEICDGIA